MSVLVTPLQNCARKILSLLSRKFLQKFHDFLNTMILKGAALQTVTQHFYIYTVHPDTDSIRIHPDAYYSLSNSSDLQLSIIGCKC